MVKIIISLSKKYVISVRNMYYHKILRIISFLSLIDNLVMKNYPEETENEVQKVESVPLHSETEVGYKMLHFFLICIMRGGIKVHPTLRSPMAYCASPG
jgi:hypothetical protein